MLSKAQIKYIRSLTQQKYRKEHHVFIAEGDKISREWLKSSARVLHIIALEEWIGDNVGLIARHSEAQVSTVEEQVLSSVSLLQTANKVLLLVEMPEHKEVLPDSGWSLGLDNIQDPGNMGTIIRIADWFGIQNIICSPNCVDVYNPKVVQAAMGSHLRISFFETDLQEFIESGNIPVFAATLSGKSIYDYQPMKEGILLIGNESKGLSPELVERASHQITIPRRGGADSLNAAVSTGIICSHIVAI
ncbi:MAG TPA: RNA methyltransferase [Flavipsychrobacter sp.]|nr:RNA methyltransferase [Flavipsychrobacter sp.]